MFRLTCINLLLFLSSKSVRLCFSIAWLAMDAVCVYVSFLRTMINFLYENDHHRVSSMSHNLMKIHTVTYFTISNCGQFSHDFLFSIFDGVYIFHLD